MSSLHNRLENATSTHPSVVTSAATNLLAQLSELNELRERVRKAELLARRPRRMGTRKECALRMEKAASAVGLF
jgi:hypothetical protein